MCIHTPSLNNASWSCVHNVRISLPLQDFRRVMSGRLSVLSSSCYCSFPLVTAFFLPMRSVDSSAVSVGRISYVERHLKSRHSLTTG